MNEKDFSDACSLFLESIREQTPWRTGNLAKATEIIQHGDAKFEIRVNEEIAPYFKYVNNAKTLTYHKYRTEVVNKKITKRKDLAKTLKVVNNKNYHYFERAVENSLEVLAKKVGGTLVHG